MLALRSPPRPIVGTLGATARPLTPGAGVRDPAPAEVAPTNSGYEDRPRRLRRVPGPASRVHHLVEGSSVSVCRTLELCGAASCVRTSEWVGRFGIEVLPAYVHFRGQNPPTRSTVGSRSGSALPPLGGPRLPTTRRVPLGRSSWRAVTARRDPLADVRIPRPRQ